MQATTVLAIGALALASASTLRAQTTGAQFGVKAGMSLATLDGSLNTSPQFKPGLAVGGFLRWRPSARVAIQPELVFSQQAATNTGVATGHSYENKIKLHYLNVPVLLKVYLGDFVNVQLGPQFGFLLSGRHTGQVGYISSTTGNNGYVVVDNDVQKDFGNDVALCGGVGVDLKNGLLFSARLNYGVTDINNNDADKALRQRLSIGGIHNRSFEFALGYAFGSK